jgi:hypothetical protein
MRTFLAYPVRARGFGVRKTGTDGRNSDDFAPK